MDARLASPALPRHKAARRHDPPRRTALGLRSRGFLIGLGRDWLAWSLDLPLLGGQHEAAAQESEARPAKHLALPPLQPVDVPFHGTATPGQGAPGFDGRIVALETLRAALQRGQRTRRRLLQPPLEPLRLPGTEELRKALGECNGLREGGVRLTQPVAQRLLPRGQVVGQT